MVSKRTLLSLLGVKTPPLIRHVGPLPLSCPCYTLATPLSQTFGQPSSPIGSPSLSSMLLSSCIPQDSIKLAAWLGMLGNITHHSPRSGRLPGVTSLRDPESKGRFIIICGYASHCFLLLLPWCINWERINIL